METNKILILGVTASGKGGLAFSLAQKLKAEIISVDSMKVYRRMDIGTAKPSSERQQSVKHHLIDVVEPSEAFSVASFLDMAHGTIDSLKQSGRPVIAVGGTALYIKALIHGLFDGPGSDEKIRTKLQERYETEGPWVMHEELSKIDEDGALRIHPSDAKRVIRALEVYELTGKTITSFQQQWKACGDEKSKANGGWTIIGLRREKNPREYEDQCESEKDDRAGASR